MRILLGFMNYKALIKATKLDVFDTLNLCIVIVIIWRLKFLVGVVF